MNEGQKYDVVVVGGGLAGLSCAILLARDNFSVALFEKETYPFHKVCGEYISFESYDFLISLGLRLGEKKLPVIRRLMLSSPSGNHIVHPLPLGGFGISRYNLDAELASIAKEAGVRVFEGVKVNDIIREGEQFKIMVANHVVAARMVCGAFGKRSNLDVKWKRPFIAGKRGALNNYIGIKYHAYLDHPADTIDLHNFRDGYCGISPVEENKFCICYLTTSQNLNRCNNNIRNMEAEILSVNPFLRTAFQSAQILNEKPLTISQISFEKKDLVYDHVLMLGDAASLIAPLCGNGMSMALHSSRIASGLITAFLEDRISRAELENAYIVNWNSVFASRLRAGRMIQSLFGREWITNTAINFLRHFPGLLTKIIRRTHGDQRSEYAAG